MRLEIFPLSMPHPTAERRIRKGLSTGMAFQRNDIQHIRRLPETTK